MAAEDDDNSSSGSSTPLSTGKEAPRWQILQSPIGRYQFRATPERVEAARVGLQQERLQQEQLNRLSELSEAADQAGKQQRRQARRQSKVATMGVAQITQLSGGSGTATARLAGNSPPSRPTQLQYASATQPPVRSRGGTKNYSNDELHALLQCIQQILPIGPEMWEMTAQFHAIKYSEHKRSAESLRKKFYKLANEKPRIGNPTISPTVALAKQVKEAIDIKAGVVKPDLTEFFNNDIQEEEVDVLVAAVEQATGQNRLSFEAMIQQRQLSEEAEWRVRRIEREEAEIKRREEREEERRRREKERDEERRRREKEREEERRRREKERDEERRRREEERKEERRQREHELHEVRLRESRQEQQMNRMLQFAMYGMMAYMVMKMKKKIRE